MNISAASKRLEEIKEKQRQYSLCTTSSRIWSRHAKVITDQIAR